MGYLIALAPGDARPVGRGNTTMAQGTISRVTDRGFGFIQQEQGGEDLFFHSSALQDVAFDELRLGDRVEFNVEPDPRGRGMRAVNVRKIDQ
jgi:CspA family cold shock protein